MPSIINEAMSHFNDIFGKEELEIPEDPDEVIIPDPDEDEENR